jgi:hypothetical protein
MDAVLKFISELHAIGVSGAGVAEPSCYPALAGLLDEVGNALKPKVKCIINLRNKGAGLPDGGFYTREQFPKGSVDPQDGALPSRGVLEVKPPSDNIDALASTDQVRGYCRRYGLVLTTNLREWLLLKADEKGEPVPAERYSLASAEVDFWAVVGQPQKLAGVHGVRLIKYLKRALLTTAPLRTPGDVAWFLASYAREALSRVEGADIPALGEMRAALEQALGMSFSGRKGEHFFRSTLVQTVFNGVFSAWVIWCRSLPAREKSFEWKQAQWIISVPFIRTIFEELMVPGRLKPLGLVEVLDWTEQTLNRVDRSAFFSQFQEEHAVQYFYEPFLEAFDPALRKELGIWYTPREIVRYQVERVDAVLRTELGITDGLADRNVVVLDPCCGTGTYLVEVLDRIARTLREKGGDALVASDIKEAVRTRVFGFEILPAPFVISHMQLGLMLNTLGAPLGIKEAERVGVFLTNALTGWFPGKRATGLPYPEREHERSEAERVKQGSRVLVVLGNPPYNAFTGVSPEEEAGLVDPYKAGLNLSVKEGGWGIKKFNLDDLYIRFFRVAERRIAEMSGRGVVSFISNHSWITEPSFVVLRRKLLSSFDKFWIENLHGNRKTSEYGPDGATSETIFAVRGFSSGIQQGVATSLWVKRGSDPKKTEVFFRDDIDASKAEERRKQLLDSLSATEFDGQYTPATPSTDNRFSFRPIKVSAVYLSWPKLTDLCAVPPGNGLMEKRGGSLIDIDREALAARMHDYFDKSLSWDEYRSRQSALTEPQAGFDPSGTREKVLAKGNRFDERQLVRYSVRPFDTRWCYYTSVNPIWNRARPTLWDQCFDGNRFILSRVACSKLPEGSPISFCQWLSDDHYLSPDASCFPLHLAPKGSRAEGMEAQARAVPLSQKANLSPTAREYILSHGIPDPDVDRPAAELLWMHVLAIGYSPAYQQENADGIRTDWPRIPLPQERATFEASAALGRRVAALLDTSREVADGICGPGSEQFLRRVGLVSRVGGGDLHPEAGDLELTAGWGHAGKGGVVMPASGRTSKRVLDPAEREAIDACALELGQTPQRLVKMLGGQTLDVFLNDRAYWRNVPVATWEYCIGGYQVLKKWLSYRDKGLLGRALDPQEAREVTAMVRRITSVILLSPALDENYRASRKQHRTLEP